MDIRKEFTVEKMLELSKTEEGRDMLSILSGMQPAAKEMLKSEELLSVVIVNEELRASMTVAHCLVFGGGEEVCVALAQMPAKILSLKTNGRDKVADFLLAKNSVTIDEALSSNLEAIGIICGEALSPTGYMRVGETSIKVKSAKEAREMSNNTVAHLLLHRNPSKLMVEAISKAPVELLDFRNGQGDSVRDLIKKAKADIKSHEQRYMNRN